MSRLRLLAGLTIAALGVVGCGGAARAPAAPAAPAAEPGQAPPSAPASPAPPPATEPAPAEEQPPNVPARPPVVAGQTEASRSFDDLLSTLASAEAAALSAGKDCPSACRALQSMQRAAEGICSLASESSDRCTSARQRVDAARDRVAQACGPCPPAPKGSVDSLQ